MREAIATGQGERTTSTADSSPSLIRKDIHPSAITLAERELTPEQLTQLSKEREAFNREMSPFLAAIRQPEKGELMKQVEKRAQEITADARRDAEKQVDQKALAEERATYEQEMAEWGRKIGTTLSLVAPPRPEPGPTMQQVEALTAEILVKRANKPQTSQPVSSGVEISAPARFVQPGELVDPGFGRVSNSPPSLDEGFAAVRRERPASLEAIRAHQKAVERAGNTMIYVGEPADYEPFVTPVAK